MEGRETLQVIKRQMDEEGEIEFKICSERTHGKGERGQAQLHLTPVLWSDWKAMMEEAPANASERNQSKPACP